MFGWPKDLGRASSRIIKSAQLDRQQQHAKAWAKQMDQINVPNKNHLCHESNEINHPKDNEIY